MAVINQSSDLDATCLDTLREVGNIGVGNAMTALATMLDRRVDMCVPEVGIMHLNEFVQVTGSAEGISVGVYMPVTGDAPGHVALILPEESARNLADTLLDKPAGSLEFDEIDRSALSEVVNIIASSCLRAIGEVTGLNLYSSPPFIAIDMTAAILSAIATTFDPMQDRALVIVTHIGEEPALIKGAFLYIPEPDSLTRILSALQMEN